MPYGIAQTTYKRAADTLRDAARSLTVDEMVELTGVSRDVALRHVNHLHKQGLAGRDHPYRPGVGRAPYRYWKAGRSTEPGAARFEGGS